MLAGRLMRERKQEMRKRNCVEMRALTSVGPPIVDCRPRAFNVCVELPQGRHSNLPVVPWGIRCDGVRGVCDLEAGLQHDNPHVC